MNFSISNRRNQNGYKAFGQKEFEGHLKPTAYSKFKKTQVYLKSKQTLTYIQVITT